MGKKGENISASEHHQLLSSLPAVSAVLGHPAIEELCEVHPRNYVHNSVRRALEAIRADILSGVVAEDSAVPTLDEIVERSRMLVRDGLGHKLMRAINGAGVILHTGLGRAPLAPSARAALQEATDRYAILATERESGRRGDRNRHTDEMLRDLTGAEASMIVNNNSAAVMLTLNTFGQGREAIVSRGELIEIGGAFRIPDVMSRSGTIMVEVGTTNRTHLRDYQAAISENSAFLLKVHTSNYRIEGFHLDVGVRDLAELAHQQGLLLLMDIGSGAMVDLRRWGLFYEPTVPEAVSDGADIVTFSGDKLLGGPQCGVIVGKRELIERMKRNPLSRAFRCDKLTLSALDGTLKLFLDPDKLPETHPIYAMMTATVEVVNRRAQRIARRIRDVTGEACRVEVTDGFTEMGSGSLPARPIPSRVVTLCPKGITPQRLGAELRLASPPLFTRIEDDSVIIDARTVADEEARLIAENFAQVIGEKDNLKSWSNRAESIDRGKSEPGKDTLPALG